MRIISRVSLLFIFVIVFVTVDTWPTNNSALSQQAPGYLSYEDCPECETEVANFNLHTRKLIEAGFGRGRQFKIPVLLFQNLELAKEIALRCLGDCEAAQTQDTTIISIMLMQVYSLFGNNPFNPLDPLSGGDTTGRGTILAVKLFVPSLNKTGFVPLLCIEGGNVRSPDGGCPCIHLHDDITLKRFRDIIDDLKPGACGHGCVELVNKDRLLPEFRDLCEGL